MRAMYKFLSPRLVDSDQSNRKRCQQHEVPLFVAVQPDFDYYLDLVVGEGVPWLLWSWGQ